MIDVSAGRRSGVWVAMGAAIAIALSGCGSLAKTVLDDPVPAAQAYRRTQNLRAMVDELAVPLIEHRETPGLIVGVRLPDGSQRVFGYGRANDKGSSPEADTVFPIGSVTKILVGAVAQVLAQRGVIDWDETLGDVLPREVALSADARRITLRQLASHTSGLPRQPAELHTLWLFTQYLFNGRDFYRDLDRDQVYAYLADWKAPEASNVQRYSNIGFALLAHVLEVRTGQSIVDLVERELTRPLALHSTSFDVSRIDALQARASGHAGDQPKFIRRGASVPDWHMNDFMRGTGGLHSTAEDLLAYADAHLRSDRGPVPRALLATLRTDPTRIGWLSADGREDGPQVYQFGVIGGYSAYLGLDTERGVGIVVLQNSFNWTDRIGMNLLRRLAAVSELERVDSGGETASR